MAHIYVGTDTSVVCTRYQLQIYLSAGDGQGSTLPISDAWYMIPGKIRYLVRCLGAPSDIGRLPVGTGVRILPFSSSGYHSAPTPTLPSRGRIRLWGGAILPLAVRAYHLSEILPVRHGPVRFGSVLFVGQHTDVLRGVVDRTCAHASAARVSRAPVVLVDCAKIVVDGIKIVVDRTRRAANR